MRPLTPEETRIFFEKLAKYIGRSIKQLLDTKGGKCCFRMHEDRIYYLRKDMIGFGKAVERKKLLSAGICFGKFQRRTRNVRLHITALEYLSEYAQYKVWIKPKAEMSFIYGNHVLKAQVLKITENTPQYHGVIVYNQQDIPLGFGSMAKSTSDARNLDPTAIMIFNQADIGEYLRSELTLFAQ